MKVNTILMKDIPSPSDSFLVALGFPGPFPGVPGRLGVSNHKAPEGRPPPAQAGGIGCISRETFGGSRPRRR